MLAEGVGEARIAAGWPGLLQSLARAARTATATACADDTTTQVRARASRLATQPLHDTMVSSCEVSLAGSRAWWPVRGCPTKQVAALACSPLETVKRVWQCFLCLDVVHFTVEHK